MDLGHDLLTLTGKRLRFLRGMAAGNHIDIRPGDKVIRFCRDKHRAAQFLIVADLADDPPYLAGELSFQGIHFFTGRVNGDDGDIVRANLKRKCRYGFHYSASRTIAEPNPPAAQAVTRPNPPPRRRSSCSVWVIIRAPVAAKG